MKKNFLRFILCTVAAILSASCADEVTYEYSSDCSITSFTLGSITRTMHTTDSDGEDSTYTITYSGSYYPMTIDQVNRKIYNRDSLPYGSSVKSVLATISAYGQVAYRETGIEGGTVSDWEVYSSSDSINFSNPVIFRVVSNDGKGEKDYEVQVNVAQQEEKAIYWYEEAASNLGNMEQIQAIAWKDSLLVLGRNQQNEIIKATRYIGPDNQSETSWNSSQTSGCEDANIRTLQIDDGKLYLTTETGQLLVSENGSVWQEIHQATPLDLLVGSDGVNLYALIGKVLHRSNNAGISWEQESLDVSESCLPTENIASVRYTQSNQIERLLIVGSRSLETYPDDTHAHVFGKILGIESENTWMHYTTDSYNDYTLPRLENLHLVKMDNLLIAFGGSVLSSSTQRPFQNFYVSIDNGITWKPNYNDIQAPENIIPTSDCFSGCSDDENRLWLLCGSKVWKGLK